MTPSSTPNSTPLLLPIHVSACALDPAVLPKLAEETDSGWSHGWSWNPPSYACLAADSQSGLRPLWAPLFDPMPPEQARGYHPPALSTAAPRRAMAISWAPPAGWGRSFSPSGEKPAPAAPGKAAPKVEERLPYLPDRWLVVRFVRRVHKGGAWDNGSVPVATAWIVDSGVRSPPPGTSSQPGTSVSTAFTGGKVSKIGALREIAVAALADDKDREVLTVRGAQDSQDVTFASFLPACLDNLGCEDDLSAVPDLAESSLSYFVVGWYREPGKHDPLHLLKHPAKGAPRSDADIREILGLAAGAGPLGDRTVLHGMVAHIDYWMPRSYGGPRLGAPQSRPVTPEWQGVPLTEPPEIGFGATAEQALATLLSRFHGEKTSDVEQARELTRFIDALLNDRVWTLDAPDTAELERHAAKQSTFESIAGGREWVVRGKETEPAVAGKAAAKGRGIRLDRPAREALDRLNAEQARLDALEFQSVAAAETLATAWWMEANEARKASTDKIRSDYRSLVDRLRGMTTALRTEAANTASVDTIKAELEALLVRPDATPLEVVRVEGPRLHRPVEPAIAIRNVGSMLLPKPKSLAGRRTEDVATKRATRAAGAPAAGDLARAPAPAGLDTLGLGALLGSLFEEAALAEAAVAALARISVDHHALESLPPVDQVAHWQTRAEALFHHLEGAAIPLRRELLDEQRVDTGPDGKPIVRTLLFESPAGTKTGLPHLCSAWTRQPWIPLFLDWEVKCGPDLIHGRTLLAHRPQQVLADRYKKLHRMSDKDKGPTLRRLTSIFGGDIARMGREDVLAQTLSGLHQRLLKRDDALPARPTPAGPLAPLLDLASLGPPRLDTVGAPPSVRDVTMRISRVRVVDRFGQFVELINPPVLAAPENLAAEPVAGEPAPPSGSRPELRLAPRLFEPSRVVFDPVNGAEASPVRGWIVLNQLDGSLAVYASDGRAEGLIRKGGEGVPAWVPLDHDAEDIADLDLRAFVHNLTVGAKARGHLEDLRAVLVLGLERTLPAGALDHPSPAARLGRPLALVSGELRVARGLPAVLASKFSGPIGRSAALKALAADLAADSVGAPALRPGLAALLPAQAAEVPISVEIGTERMQDDGLVGFYVGRAEGTVRRTRKTAVSGGATAITLKVGDRESSAVRLLLLLDPLGRIYLEPDRLPALAVSVPIERYEEELRSLPAILAVSPVLLSSHDTLRSLFGGPGGGGIDLPFPTTTRGTPDAAAKTTRAAPRARLSVSTPTLGAVEARVEPSPPTGPVHDADVAAIEAFLLF